MAVARYRPDGELDPTFSQDGVVTVDSGGADAGLTVLVERRGSILVGGSADERFLLVRLAPDGQLDPSLDQDGVLIRSELMPAASIASASGDRIVVGSGIRTDAEVTAAAVRLRADASPDPRFGTDGVGRIDPRFTPFADFGAHLVAVLADDSVLVGAQEVLVRLAPTGELDSGFGQSGALYFGPVAAARSIAVRPNGEFFVGVARTGLALGPGSAENATALVTDEGERVAVFAHDQGSELALDPAGNLLLAGGRPGGELPRTLTISRFRSNLKPDLPFGRRGRAPGYVRLLGTDTPIDIALAPGGEVLALAPVMGDRPVLARFEIAPGPADADADGVRDSRDACPYGHAENRSGCIPVARSLKLKRRKRNLKIDLDARSASCIVGARVRLFVKRPGPDRRAASQLVEVVYHQRAVFYSAPAGRARSYYAIAVPNDTAIAHCRRARSGTVRVPGR